MPYFGEPVGRVKIQTTSKNSQRYYTTKRLIRDLLSNTPNCYVVEENSASIYLQGMRDRSVGSGTKFAREIQLTDWSTAGNLSNRSSGLQIPRDICTRFRRYLYSRRCSWIIMGNIAPRSWQYVQKRHACFEFAGFRKQNKNRSAMRTWGLMLNYIPFGWNAILEYQHLGVDLL